MNASPAQQRCVAAVFSRGIERIPGLRDFLEVDEVRTNPSHPESSAISFVAGWGTKKNTGRARAYARRHGLSYVSLEDGFLRSVGLGVEGAPPLSMIVDPVGVYYDATRPSRLEQLLCGDDDESPVLEDPEMISRARSLIDRILACRLSKYNNSPPGPRPPYLDSTDPPVLVIDQTRHDQSIRGGLMTEACFERMLQAAIEENPDRLILVKTHPDVMAGKKSGHFDLSVNRDRVRVIADAVNPITLLEGVGRVYTGTSQMGFEALMMGKQVVCFGAPFYAGWGLTDDRVAVPRRGRARSVEQVFAAAYILYSRYVCPDSGRRGTIEEVVEHLALQRRYFDANPGSIHCLGFSRWKRNYVRAYLRCPGNDIVFNTSSAQALRRGFDEHAHLLVWGTRNGEDTERLATSHGTSVWRMEDGFLRSIGLGSDLTLPASLVIDRSGIYYDPSQPSDLEHLLQREDRGPEVLERAAALRELIVSTKLSKYNVDSTKGVKLPDLKGRRVILVPGQVEDDASIRLGCVDIRTNTDLLKIVRQENPDAFVVYKPHPDVVSGNRTGNVPAASARAFADHVVREASIASCLDVADEVHTMTSLVGFEALLRGLKVTTYGRPFYASYGLTTDRHPMPRRRDNVTLDEMVAAALIEYPRYINADTRAFTTPEFVVSNLVARRQQDAGRTSAKSSYLARRLRKLRNVVKGVFNV